MRIRELLVVLAVPLVFIAGCGAETDSTAGDSTSSSPASAPSSPSTSVPPSATSNPPSATASGPALPDCAEVWVDGAALPRGYQGCEADGERVKAASTYCEFGRPLVTYADRFYAVPSGTIHGTEGPLKGDRGYQQALSSCMA